MLDVINIVRGSNEKMGGAAPSMEKFHIVLLPKQNSAPVSLKLRIKSEVRMKTHNTRKRTGDQPSFFFLHLMFWICLLLPAPRLAAVHIFH
jgi:hypothetical protein